ncbi:MAG: hypothetical protein KTR31_29890 [Myxococcales bacterium]|nr:hypothetical protein [Myxococcales bacterium]
MRLHYVLALSAILTACDGEFGTDAPLAIAGSYSDDFGGSHAISDASWVQDYGAYGVTSFTIVAHHNDEGWVVAQNDSDNDFNPDLWSRFEWVEVEGTLYYCQILFDGAEEDDAYAAGPADAADPATAGCGGAPWTALR